MIDIERSRMSGDLGKGLVERELPMNRIVSGCRLIGFTATADAFAADQGETP